LLSVQKRKSAGFMLGNFRNLHDVEPLLSLKLITNLMKNMQGRHSTGSEAIMGAFIAHVI